jgi:hypothetical protein
MTTTRTNAERYKRGDIEALISQLGKRYTIEIPKILKLHKWLDEQRLCRGSCRVVGESFTGKTIASATYCLKRSITQSVNQPVSRPVIYWHCPASLTKSDVIKGLLQSFSCQIPPRIHHSQAIRGYNLDLHDCLYQVLRQCQVEMILLDQAHNLSLNALSNIQEIANYLEISIVLVGTDRLNALLGKEEKLHYHFLPSYRYMRFNADEHREFTALWHEYVLKMPEFSNLTSPKAQSILLSATQGLVGLLDQILRKTAVRAIKQGESQISLDLLKQVIVEFS